MANDPLVPDMFSAGIWAGAMPLLATGIVVLVAIKTKNMVWCCILPGMAICALLEFVSL